MPLLLRKELAQPGEVTEWLGKAEPLGGGGLGLLPRLHLAVQYRKCLALLAECGKPIKEFSSLRAREAGVWVAGRRQMHRHSGTAAGLGRHAVRDRLQVSPVPLRRHATSGVEEERLVVHLVDRDSGMRRRRAIPLPLAVVLANVARGKSCEQHHTAGADGNHDDGGGVVERGLLLRRRRPAAGARWERCCRHPRRRERGRPS
mmetsp:Transcript_5795/g.14737  ORF Transcript_5795/g.14737 Transcript_5795/m.14737 type:complete len:203 (-) Transcript_5795:587-1195(-)